MALKMRNLSEGLGVEIEGLDLRKVMSSSIKRQINETFVNSVVLVFREQELNAEQFLKAAKVLASQLNKTLAI